MCEVGKKDAYDLLSEYELLYPDGSDVMCLANTTGYLWRSASLLQDRMSFSDSLLVDCLSAGVAAVLQCHKDNEAEKCGKLSPGAKRYIQREMLRSVATAAPSRQHAIPRTSGAKVLIRQSHAIPVDYGYLDGRHCSQELNKTSPRNRKQRCLARKAEQGFCSRCGCRKPPAGFKTCQRCRDRKNRNRTNHSQ